MPEIVDRRALEIVLAEFGQQHLTRYWEELSDLEQASLAHQIELIDWPSLSRLVNDRGCEDDLEELTARAQPPRAITSVEFREPKVFAEAWDRGAAAISARKVAFVLTAGGQGTRLGFDHPKGMYPIGPVSKRSLFQILIEHARARSLQFAGCIPIYVMTSPQTDEATRAFLGENNWFGYSPNDLRIFCQGTMPVVDAATGRVLLESRGAVATSPDGHGGMLDALVRSGGLADMQRRGIEFVFYGQIDNPLLQVCHPALIGFHEIHHSELTTQVIRKSEPLQRVGNVVQVDGRMRIIEYSDFPELAATRLNSNGELKFWAGSIAVHIFNRSFLERASRNESSLPFHRAIKKVPFVDNAGRLVEPADCNAQKFERFIFDLLPFAENPLVCEVEANEGFAALKNAPPASRETAEWVRKSMSDLHKKWIGQVGGSVADDTFVEISPFYAVDERQLMDCDLNGKYFTTDTFLA